MTLRNRLSTANKLNKFRAPSPELSLSLMVSIGALQVVNSVERTVSRWRQYTSK